VCASLIASPYNCEKREYELAIWQIVLLAMVQGFAELLPVSSSAHVIVVEKMLGLDPSTPEMTLLLVTLHTGTMFAVIVYFWNEWRQVFFPDLRTFKRFVFLVVLATALTGVIGGVLVRAIETSLSQHHRNAEVEQIFSHLEFIASALFAVGILILISDVRNHYGKTAKREFGPKQAFLVAAAQGLAIPFRGFSRSGATISTAMLAGVDKPRAEAFSFALAVVLTPPAMLRESHRFITGQGTGAGLNFASGVTSAILGMACAFVAGLIALKWLSAWLESGRWYIFGLYCIGAAAGVLALWSLGY
jgi:undecaprenyl-diphosphatase